MAISKHVQLNIVASQPCPVERTTPIQLNSPLSKTKHDHDTTSGAIKRRKTALDGGQAIITNITKYATNNECTVSWICAIATEYVAAQGFLDEKYDRPECMSPNDNNIICTETDAYQFQVPSLDLSCCFCSLNCEENLK